MENADKNGQAVEETEVKQTEEQSFSSDVNGLVAKRDELLNKLSKSKTRETLLSAEVETTRGQLESMTAKYDSLVKQNLVESVLAQVNPLVGAEKFLRSEVEALISVEVSESGDRQAIARNAQGMTDVKQIVDDIRSNNASIVLGTGATGVGAQGASGSGRAGTGKAKQPKTQFGIGK